MNTLEDLKKALKAHEAQAFQLNYTIADDPELSGEEYHACRHYVDLCRSLGMDVEEQFTGQPTAFRAIAHRADKPVFKMALLAEYDALPGVGHGCGHSANGAMSFLAAAALKDLKDLPVDVDLIGTPDEELRGGKVIMCDQGVFKDYDFAVMVHVSPTRTNANSHFLALDDYRIAFHGQTAHAAGEPWNGRNALNGAMLALHAVDMLRQHVTPDVRMHGIYKKAGVVPNIVPEEASVHFYMRAVDKAYLQEVHRMVDDCARGAAIMTQTTWDTFKVDATYDCMKNNPAGISVMKEVYEELGIDINGDHDKLFGSSDIGNVSFACPAFHPTLQIVDRGVAIHTREFADAVKTQRAHDAIKLGAEVISLHITKTFMDEDKIKAMKEDFNK